MESPSDPPPPPDDVQRPVSAPGDGKIRRIAAQTRGLVEDLREWIDLRIDLALLEVEERVDELRNELALGLAVAVLGFFAALFVLTTVAVGLGWLLGHPFWGFLIVSVFLTAIVVVLRTARPGLLPPSDLFQRLRERRSTQHDEDSSSSRDSVSEDGAPA